jgi:hypothetical protein
MKAFWIARVACGVKRARGAMVTAGYRFSDGAFISHSIMGADRITYHFDTPDPGKQDRPVAIEFRLADKA